MMTNEGDAIIPSDAAINDTVISFRPNYRSVSAAVRFIRQPLHRIFRGRLRKFQRSAGICSLVLTIHALIIVTLMSASSTFSRSIPLLPLINVSLAQTRKIVPIVTTIAIAAVSREPLGAESPRLLSIADNIAVEITEQPRGRIRPPYPIEPSIDPKPFAMQAGLLKGSGATVVLRVEVLGNGGVGRIQVEISGGNKEVDQAATAYVRALRWAGGRLDDKPETLWVRWGVRLDG